MKTIHTLILLTFCLAASAQKRSHNNFSQHINDDGNTLQIWFKGDNNGHAIDYHHTFNVKGMSMSEKNALTKRIVDSLGITNITPPSPPTSVIAPEPPAPPAINHANKDKRNHISSSIHDDGETMQVNIIGMQNNRSVYYKNTFKVKGMAAKEKNAMVKHIADSLGVSHSVQLKAN